MNSKLKQSGFSLTEVLLAVGTLALGMALIAGVFPVAVHFTTQTIERTTAAVVADEAFAKIKLYKIDFTHTFWAGPPDPTLNCIAFGNVTQYAALNTTAITEYLYPSLNTNTNQQYSWSAICRLVNLPTRSVQVTVFVCRKIGRAAIYIDPMNFLNPPIAYPMPVPVAVSQNAPDELSINNLNIKTFINDGYTIVDNETGRIYRVLERYKLATNDNIIQLDRPWVPGINIPPSVWVIPPPVNGGRGPCIGVFQKVISF